MDALTRDDLRAAVAAGTLTEAQAASVLALAESRSGQRAAMRAEDEPFEFFRGFSEVFISIGLIILLTGVAAMLGWFGGEGILVAVPLGSAAIAWWWAHYFTLKRRMNLPSMVLASAFGGGVFLSSVTVLAMAEVPDRGIALGAFLLTTAALGLWYRRFHLPFAMFLAGCSALGVIYSITVSTTTLYALAGSTSGFEALFDLGSSPAFAGATLVFGIGAFLFGMWFDTRDPHRLGRHAATAFWLHLLAAPALVNTVALTLYNTGGTGGMVLLFAALIGITLLALVIDRRSFLSAGIGYLALVIGWIVQGESGGDFGRWTLVLIALGGTITAIGTWWVPLRAALMRALPPFPGKDRLPPYARLP